MQRRIISLLLSLGLYLSVHNGHLAIFDTDATQPLTVLPYPTSAFPQNDQKTLQQGIPFDTQEELAQLLEDFLS